ncbi:hypothetical protein [Actibacterium sp. MT2.3-13A]|uniref:hypothetical protein n=1 Tax=Actibacterium sp. MT2.3-13A TaxID=2828332 RepID=UPI001BAB32ED|nr:hypothetical protein [Actibacterium sp. MT2.3-13A]
MRHALIAFLISATPAVAGDIQDYQSCIQHLAGAYEVRDDAMENMTVTVEAAPGAIEHAQAAFQALDAYISALADYCDTLR